MGEIESQRNEKPVPVGQRPLPNIYIESEIGQADNSCAEERGEGGEVHSGGDQGAHCRGIGISELSYFDSGDEPWWLRWDISCRPWITSSCTRPAVVLCCETLRSIGCFPHADLMAGQLVGAHMADETGFQ